MDSARREASRVSAFLLNLSDSQATDQACTAESSLLLQSTAHHENFFLLFLLYGLLLADLGTGCLVCFRLLLRHLQAPANSRSLPLPLFRSRSLYSLWSPPFPSRHPQHAGLRLPLYLSLSAGILVLFHTYLHGHACVLRRDATKLGGLHGELEALRLCPHWRLLLFGWFLAWFLKTTSSSQRRFVPPPPPPSLPFSSSPSCISRGFARNIFSSCSACLFFSSAACWERRRRRKKKKRKRDKQSAQQNQGPSAEDLFSNLYR